MNGFSFYCPTKIYFGRDSTDICGTAAKECGATRVLIHYGGQTCVKNGLLCQIEKTVAAQGLYYITLGGAKPNPVLSLVREGIDLCKRENIDFIIAVGGGSVIDSAKAIALGAANPKLDIWDDIYCGKTAPKTSLPVGVVLTIAAAGSETSRSAVITNDDNGIKQGFSSDLNRPHFACMDPTLTYTLPPYQTASGIVDIMMHTLERYFASGRGNEMSDRIAEQLLSNVVCYGKIAMDKPDDYKARSEIMWAGSLSHNGLTGLGGSQAFVAHPMEHPLSGIYDVTHGAGLAVIWCKWARYVYERDWERFAQYAVNVWGCDEQSDDLARVGIEKTELFFRQIGMPLTFSELGIGVLSEDELSLMANRVTKNGTKTIGCIPLDFDDIMNIYRSCNV